MKLTISGTGMTEKRANALLNALWDLNTPEQIGSCQEAYDSDKRELYSLLGRPFTFAIEVHEL